MKFHELDLVRLIQDKPNEGLKMGDIGVVVLVYTMPSEAYEVEFINRDDTTEALVTLLPNEIIKA